MLTPTLFSIFVLFLLLVAVLPIMDADSYLRNSGMSELSRNEVAVLPIMDADSYEKSGGDSSINDGRSPTYNGC